MQAIGMVYSEYYGMDIFVKKERMKDHPAKYDEYAINDPDYDCENCECKGFPCKNCAQYVYNFKLGTGYPLESPKKESDSDTDSSTQSLYLNITEGKKWADLDDDELDPQFSFSWD